MTKNNSKRIKEVTYQSEEQQEVKRFIILLVVIVILIIGVYFFTRIFVTKDLLNKENPKETIPGSIDYTVASIGSMLSRPEKEYYVIMYDSKNVNAIYYGGLVSTYKRNTDPLKVYTVDLSNELNKKYVDKDNINVNTNDIENFRVGEVALLKIENGKIAASYTNDEEIAKILEYKKDAAS